MRILITGATGMLGGEVLRAVEEAGHEPIPMSRAEFDVTRIDHVDHWIRTTQPDSIINCAGLIPDRHSAPSEVLAVNAVAPHLLAEIGLAHDAHLVHVSTDCVFGHAVIGMANRAWGAQEHPIPDTLYSVSKLAGEVSDGSTSVVRTSFIGPRHGLWQWFADQPHGARVDGWTRAHWSGSTVDEVARLLVRAVEDRPAGIVHAATRQIWSKGDVLGLLQNTLGRHDIQLSMHDQPEIHRALTPSPGWVLEFGAEQIAALAGRTDDGRAAVGGGDSGRA